MTEGKQEADGDRALALLHQLARHIIDCGDMIGIDGVAQPKTVGEQRGAQQTPDNGGRPRPPKPTRKH
jgi:hypothetical protein